MYHIAEKMAHITGKNTAHNPKNAVHNLQNFAHNSTIPAQKCQIAVNWVGTVARCWFIHDSTCLRGWHVWQWVWVILHFCSITYKILA